MLLLRAMPPALLALALGLAVLRLMGPRRVVPAAVPAEGEGPEGRGHRGPVAIGHGAKDLLLRFARTKIGGSVGWRLPDRVQMRIRDYLLEQRVAAGFRLVPEPELEACYVSCLELLDRLGRERGDYVEFGVYHGASLACMYRAAEIVGWRDVRFVGFDSFEGLPAEADIVDRGVWMAGECRSDMKITRRFLDGQGVDWSRVELVKGWFSDTLRHRPEVYGVRHASVIMVDCDLSTSAREALRFCYPLIGETAVLLFDDWYSNGLADDQLGEKAAFDEWLVEHPVFEITRLDSYSPNAEVVLLRRKSSVEQS